MIGSGRAENIERRVFRGESFFFCAQGGRAARLLSDRKWKAMEVNFPSEFLPRIISEQL